MIPRRAPKTRIFGFNSKNYGFGDPSQNHMIRVFNSRPKSSDSCGLTPRIQILFREFLIEFDAFLPISVTNPFAGSDQTDENVN